MGENQNKTQRQFTIENSRWRHLSYVLQNDKNDHFWCSITAVGKNMVSSNNALSHTNIFHLYREITQDRYLFIKYPPGGTISR